LEKTRPRVPRIFQDKKEMYPLNNGSGLYMISQPSKRSRTKSFSHILAARTLERGQKIDEAGDGGASEGTLDVR